MISDDLLTAAGFSRSDAIASGGLMVIPRCVKRDRERYGLWRLVAFPPSALLAKPHRVESNR